MIKTCRQTKFGEAIRPASYDHFNDMKKNLLLLLCCGLVQVTPLIYRFAFGYSEEFIYPSMLSHTMLIVPLVVVFSLKNRYTKTFLIIWISWLFIGELKILTYYNVNPYFISMDEGCIIYNLFLVFMSLGMLLHDVNTQLPALSESARAKGRVLITDLSWLEPVLVAFPLIWFADFIRSVGFIPIFAGTDVTNLMYEINYGYVYNYGFLNSIAAVLIYDRYLKSQSTPRRVMWVVLLGMALLIMSIDSKRLFLLTSLLAVFVYDKIKAGALTVDTRTLVMLGCGTMFYILLQNLRLGDASDSPFARDGLPLGAEFREYIRAVNEYEPGQIPNYDFAASMVGAFVNSFVLRIAGFDKGELVAKDSAYSFMTLFDEENTLGIRTGLISELYFAYGFYALILITLFGVLISYLSYRLITVRLQSSLVLLSAIWGLLVLSVFGQTSVTVGCLCILMYLYIIIRLVKLTQNRNQGGAAHYDLHHHPGSQPETLHPEVPGLFSPTDDHHLSGNRG